MILSLDGRQVNELRLFRPFVGAWWADVSLDTSAGAKVPTGRVELNVHGRVLSGTVEPRASGQFGTIVRARVVAGGGGWGSPVPPQHFRSSTGVTLGSVVRSSAAAVGETVGELEDEALGTDYVRSGGPASRVFGAREWHVDDAGRTIVRPRTTSPAPAAATVRDYDPTTGCATVASLELVEPGWTFTDPRFASLVVRDVQTTLNRSGQTTIAWCSARAASPLASLLRSAVVELSGATYLREYRYRVYGLEGDRVNLQIVSPATGIPDALPVEMSPGVAGVHAELELGAEVRVVFLEGDERYPRVVGFEGRTGERWRPKTLTLDATERVVIGAGGAPAVLGGEAWFQAVTSALGSLGAPIVAPPPTMSAKLESE